MSYFQIVKELKSVSNVQKTTVLARFFKTESGEYGEGDIFWGIVVPQQRIIAKKFLAESLGEVQKLIDSPIHEQRLTGLLILTYQFPKADDELKRQIFEFYLANSTKINNWDLVDLSSPNIVGAYLYNFVDQKKTLQILSKLAHSNLWQRRVAILASFYFIKQKQFSVTLKLAEILLSDKHDLIHKAVGWMLREIGKRDLKAELDFLDKYYKKMPRTMLRYAIEKFDETSRKKYLARD